MLKFENQFSQIICHFHMDLKSTQTLIANVPALSCNENNRIIPLLWYNLSFYKKKFHELNSLTLLVTPVVLLAISNFARLLLALNV